MAAENLQEIDIICLDPGGSVQARYKEFICFRDLRFFSRSTENYLSFIAQTGHTPTAIEFGGLQHGHARFLDVTRFEESEQRG